MNTEKIFKFLIYSILPLIIFIAGMSANLFGLITISRQKLKPILIYQLLFIFDIIYLQQILIDFIEILNVYIYKNYFFYYYDFY
jgi:hypothetical protein